MVSNLRPANVGLLLGKPAHRSPTLDAMRGMLVRRGNEVHVHVPSRTDIEPSWLGRVAVIAVRGLDDVALRALIDSETVARWCDAPAAIDAAQDRDRLAVALEAAGVRTAGPKRRQTWDAVRATTMTDTVVVKNARSTVGRGAQVLMARPDQLPLWAPFPGPYTVEHRIVTDGPEHKLYRIGDRTFASTGGAAHQLHHLDRFTRLADKVAAATRLTVLGIDVLPTADTPVVIDVNAFPSCRRVPDAPRLLADHLGSLAAGAEYLS